MVMFRVLGVVICLVMAVAAGSFAHADHFEDAMVAAVLSVAGALLTNAKGES